MKLIVNPHKIEIVKELVNEKEIDITKCEFEFSEEITDDFVKEAYFTLNNETYKQIIENNECKIPYEVLKEKGQVEIGCVAFLVENEQEIKRYNPSPVYISTLSGSLKDEFENSEPITPTDKEQIEQMLNNINVDANKEGKITTITITFKDGTTKDVTLEDGMGIDYNWVGTQLGIKREDEQEYEYVDLKGEKGDAGAIRMRIVQELPFVGDDDTMYLVPLEEPETEDNRYAEYIYVNNQWELLGKIGIQVDLSDYYTKSQVYNKEETDTKVNAKYTKPSDGIPKEDLTQSVQTSLNKADSSIQDVSGKEDKSNKVTSLSSSSTNTQYPSAKCVYDSQEEQNNDIQTLQEKNNELKGILNNIYDIDNYLINNHSIESEETTESITLNNTMNKAPMSLTLKGNIEQDSTTGKNLLHLQNQTRTHNGLTGTYEDGVLTFSGTATSNYSTLTTGSSNTLPAGTYTLSIDKTITAQIRLRLNLEDSTQYNVSISAGETSATFTLEQPASSYYIFLNVLTSGTSYNETIKIQLESGSSATNWEPYTGSSPSPNPSYPQDIHIVSGDNEIKVCNSNIFDGEMELGSINSSGTKITNDTLIRTKNYTPVEENTDYILSTTLSASGYTRNFIWFYDENYNKIRNVTKANGNYFTTVEETKYILFRPDYATTDTTLKFWLNKGQTTLPYQEHQEYTKEINLPVENLFDVSSFESQLVNGKILNDNGVEINDSSSQYSKYMIPVKANTTYYRKGAWQRMYIYDINKNFISRTSGVSGFDSPYTPTQDGYIEFQINNVYWANNKGQEQLEKGSKANSYTPYGTTPIEVGDIGEYEDEFFKNTTDSEYYDSTLEQDKWYLKKKIGKYIFTGNETPSTITGGYFYYASSLGNMSYIIGGYNTKFQFVNDDRIIDNGSANDYLSNNQMAFRLGSGKDRLYIKTQLSSNDLKSTLANTPLYYVLATPENILLNNTLQETLDSFYSMQEQTNISQSNNDLPFVIKARAIKEIL